jgi:hypothetical protein
MTLERVWHLGMIQEALFHLVRDTPRPAGDTSGSAA